jgi:hypothetical protein
MRIARSPQENEFTPDQRSLLYAELARIVTGLKEGVTKANPKVVLDLFGELELQQLIENRSEVLRLHG